jgi:hypothetical protein
VLLSRKGPRIKGVARSAAIQIFIDDRVKGQSPDVLLASIGANQLPVPSLEQYLFAVLALFHDPTSIPHPFPLQVIN